MTMGAIGGLHIRGINVQSPCTGSRQKASLYLIAEAVGVGILARLELAHNEQVLCRFSLLTLEE